VALAGWEVSDTAFSVKIECDARIERKITPFAHLKGCVIDAASGMFILTQSFFFFRFMPDCPSNLSN
jgi:hypothetical protein